MTLSQKRADKVKVELIKLGVSKARIKAKSYVYSEPIATNNKSKGRQKNRRTEFMVIKN